MAGVGAMPEKLSGVTGKSAARVAAHREKFARLDLSVKPGISQTIDDLATMYGCPKAVVVRSLLRFALTNRDWKSQGLLLGD